MLKNRALLSVVVVLLLVGLAAGDSGKTNPPPVQGCVACVLRYGCYTCAGGSQGLTCNTLDCSNCITSGICSSPTQPTEFGAVKSNGPTTGTDGFTIDPDLIAMVGEVHPRFAATLANMNNLSIGIRPDTYQVHWSPVPIKSSEVGAFLHRSDNQEFLTDLNRRARAIDEGVLSGKISEIIYQVDVEQTAEGVMVKLTVLQGSDIDPAFKHLTLNMVPDHEKAALMRLSTWTIE